MIADAAGPAAIIREQERSADGGRAADRLGQWSWALFEGARDPNVLFQIYIISPFFATVMMHDAIRGQELWGDTIDMGRRDHHGLSRRSWARSPTKAGGASPGSRSLPR